MALVGSCATDEDSIALLGKESADSQAQHTVEVAASHASPVSQPDAIAELIKLAAR